MTQPLNLALTLSLNDRLVAPLQRALTDAGKELTKVSRELDQIGRTGENAARGLDKVGKQADGLRRTTSEVEKLGRETREAERSATRLASAWGQIRNVTRGIGGLVAGGTAATAVLAGPVRRELDYDTQLRGLANTAFAGQSIGARRAGVRSLDASITGAVRAGGGTREGAVETLNELVASGVFKNPADAAALLPLLQRGGTASGASSVDLARIAIRAQQSFGIGAAQMPQVLDQAMAAGQAGGFELKDLAKWLPQQMAASRSLGLSGSDGLIKLLAANQASVITSGSKDEAGNNLVNLLAKVNSQDTAKDFQKLGIDLPGSLAAARGKGVDGLTAFVNMVDGIAAKDPRFQAARKGAAAAGSDAERRASYESQGDILQGSAVGKVIQDRQALMALVAMMNNRGYMADVEGKIRAGGGSMGDAFGLMSEGAGYKVNQANFEKLHAQTEALGNVNGALGKLSDATVDLYQKFPKLGEAIEGTKVGLTALMVFLGGLGLMNLLTRGGGAAAVAAGGGAAVTGAGAGFMATAAAATKGLGRLGGGVGMLASALFSTSDSDMRILMDDEAMQGGYRGKGFADPRLASGSPNTDLSRALLTAADRLSNLNIHITTDNEKWVAEILSTEKKAARRD